MGLMGGQAGQVLLRARGSPACELRNDFTALPCMVTAQVESGLPKPVSVRRAHSSLLGFVVCSCCHQIRVAVVRACAVLHSWAFPNAWTLVRYLWCCTSKGSSQKVNNATWFSCGWGYYPGLIVLRTQQQQRRLTQLAQGDCHAIQAAYVHID